MWRKIGMRLMQWLQFRSKYFKKTYACALEFGILELGCCEKFFSSSTLIGASWILNWKNINLQILHENGMKRHEKTMKIVCNLCKGKFLTIQFLEVLWLLEWFSSFPLLFFLYFLCFYCFKDLLSFSSSFTVSLTFLKNNWKH